MEIVKIERQTVRLPTRWAHHLVTRDVRGMTPEDIARIADVMKPHLDGGWYIVGIVMGSERDGESDFTLHRQRTLTQQYGKEI